MSELDSVPRGCSLSFNEGSLRNCKEATGFVIRICHLTYPPTNPDFQMWPTKNVDRQLFRKKNSSIDLVLKQPSDP